MIQFIIGFILSTIISILAYKKKSLSISGFYAAIIVSTLLYFFGGFTVWFILMAFFISSSLLTKYKENEKEKYTLTHEKGGERDYLQVLANGFLSLLFSFLFYITNNEIFQIVAVVSIASSNSDTWASELGILSKGKTISIVTFKPIKKGQSGGVSVFGLFAGLLGSSYIASIYSALLYINHNLTLNKLLMIFPLVSIGGFIGCLIDSYLGATIQAKYKTPHHDELIEKSVYKNRKAELVSGFKLITNDVVNISSAVLASLSILLYVYIT